MLPAPGANGSLATTAKSTGGSGGGGVAGWFSSLRRQPKTKKTSVSKALQKSCVDLSTAAAGPVVLAKGAAPMVPGSGKPMPPNDPAASDTKTESVLKQTSSVWTFNNAPVHHTSSAVSVVRAGPAVVTHTETIQLDRQRRVTPAVATSHTKIVHTTVTTKQSHRVGLVFNDDGELISKVDDAFRNFANTLNTQLGDGNAALLGRLALITGGRAVAASGHSNANSDSDSCRSSSLGGSSNQLDGGGEIEFIDCDRSPSTSVTPPPLLAPAGQPVKCEVNVTKVYASVELVVRHSTNGPLKCFCLRHLRCMRVYVVVMVVWEEFARRLH